MGFLASAPRILAVLGPTNTGKTHLAIERMLGHATGMIGFPLRLLARENYDRVVRLKGARAVALITGEEKIVPPQPRLFRLHRRIHAARPAASSSWPSTRSSSAAMPSAAMSSPIACSHARGLSRDHVPRRRHHPAAAAPAGARGGVRRPAALLHPALSRAEEADAPAAAQRRRRLRRRRCLRAGRADAPPARRHARWCWARSARARAMPRLGCSSRARSITWSRPTPSAWGSTWISTMSPSPRLRKFDGRAPRRPRRRPRSRRSPAAPAGI